MSSQVSRRHFFYGSLLAGAVPTAGFGSVASLRSMGYKSPNEKLNIAAIGSGGKGFSDINGCLTENIVALTDPDDKRAERTFKQFPNLPKYKDFRRMFDKHEKEIDAVLVSCPDHMHGTASMWAMARGKHVYCQKPLVRTVWEAQQLAARRRQIRRRHADGQPGLFERRRPRMRRDHLERRHRQRHRGPCLDRPPRPLLAPKPRSRAQARSPRPRPSRLGRLARLRAEARPFSPAYAPHHWRGFPEFGCGAIGDMACHILGTPNMAMRLSLTGPTSVECVKKEGVGKYCFPHQTVIRFDFPARGSMGPLKLFWYDSLKDMPKFDAIPAGTADRRQGHQRQPLHRRQRHGHHRLLRRKDPPHARRKDEADYKGAAQTPHPLPRPLPRLDPRLQRRRPRLLQLLRRRPLRRMDAARRHRHALRRPARMGRTARKQFTNNKEANKYLKPEFRKGYKFNG
jgi:predicted dehydrogenase